MQALIDYIQKYAVRGECLCGRCCDKCEDTPAPEHSAPAGLREAKIEAEEPQSSFEISPLATG